MPKHLKNAVSYYWASHGVNFLKQGDGNLTILGAGGEKGGGKKVMVRAGLYHPEKEDQ